MPTGGFLAGTFWTVTIVLAGLYCLVRGAVDLKHRCFVWGVLGVVIGCAIFVLPIETHAVKVDLPAPRR